MCVGMDAMLKRQDKATVTSLQGCVMQLTMDDTFMLKSESGCFPTGLLIEESWQGALTGNKML